VKSVDLPVFGFPINATVSVDRWITAGMAGTKIRREGLPSSESIKLNACRFASPYAQTVAAELQFHGIAQRGCSDDGHLDPGYEAHLHQSRAQFIGAENRTDATSRAHGQVRQKRQLIAPRRTKTRNNSSARKHSL
jgi:hypothetical protein